MDALIMLNQLIQLCAAIIQKLIDSDNEEHIFPLSFP